MNLTDEQKMIQETAFNIGKQELAPRAADVDRKGSYPRDGLKKLAETGFLGITVPKILGGGGSDSLSFVLATEGIARGCASTGLVFVTNGIVARALVAAGSDEQKSRLLPALTAGHRIAAFAATEPVSGSNPFAIATKAVRDRDDFVINGTKNFITSSEEAEVYLVVLRTDQSKSPADLSAIIIEKGTPGFSFGKKEDTMGLRGSSDGELIFQNCRVPRANLLGAENGYLAVMPRFAGLSMLGAAGIALGIAQSAADAAIEHAKTREVAGQPIGQYQGIQYLLAEMAISIAAARELTYSAARQLDGPPPPPPLPLYMAKLYATEMAIEVANKALQVHGGTGYSRELPLERHCRDARGLTLHFTPSEMLKGMLGKMLMGMPPF
ncbi:MAG: acyl-CoA dehydrogenase family protein [Dehalococcoidia bacterium]|nr:acyl-CoA dehydrogenase family protein [Dehalococcoidia bacterium]MDZ4246256.1 acyl-CoA dehydrogenase family protein [Dehalococcoidia bacterium]